MYTNLVSSNLSNADLELGEPFSRCELPCWPVQVDDILPPVKVNGNFECAVPASEHGVFLLSIPDQHHDATTTTLSCTHVYTGNLNSPKTRCSPFGFRYALTFDRPMSSPGWAFIPYRDSLAPQRHVLSTSSESQIISDHAYIIHGVRRVIFDQYLHRIVASDFRTFFFVDLTPSFPRPPSNPSSTP
jgi:hypothetical protein